LENTTQEQKTDKRWIGLLVLFSLAGVIETIYYGQISAFTPLYLPTLGIPVSEVPRWTGIIASVSGLLGLPFLPFWGALADRFARKPIIIRSFGVHLISGTVLLFASSVGGFLAGRAISSLALGNTGLMITTLSERVPKRRSGLAISILNTAGPIGIVLGPLFGGPIVDHFGFRFLLGINAGLMLLVILSLSFGYRDPFTGTNRGSILQMAGDSVQLILKSPRLRALFPALFVLFAGWVMALTYLPIAITQIYKGTNSGTIVGIILGAGGLISLFLGPGIGALGDRYGHWKVLFMGAVIEVLLWPLPTLFHQNLVVFGAAWALINGVATGVFSLSFSVLALSTPSEVRGRVMSFAYLPVNVGSIVGPIIGSMVTQGSIFTIFPVSAALTALGIGLLAMAARQAVGISVE
jgi:DHA1 family multidrug resistance protein-like MFS transporter